MPLKPDIRKSQLESLLSRLRDELGEPWVGSCVDAEVGILWEVLA